MAPVPGDAQGGRQPPAEAETVEEKEEFFPRAFEGSMALRQLDFRFLPSRAGRK